MSAPASDQVTSIEEQSSTRGRRMVQGESGGGSNDPPVAAIADELNVMLSVVIQSSASTQPQPQPSNGWLSSLMNEGGESGESSNNTTLPPKHKIQEVPQLLRQVETNEKCYDPEVVSIGPYHHKDPKLKSFEKFKIHFTREYVKSCNLQNVTALYDKVAEVAGEARNCYAEGSTKDFDDTAFTQMMFLDGCFILQYIHYNYTEDKTEQAKMKMKNHDKAFVQRDLFLLENQLPFIVLQALMSMNSNFDGDKGMTLINEFIKNTRASPSPQYSLLEKYENFITKYITNREGSHEQARGSSTISNSQLGEPRPAHLLELMHRQLIKPDAFTTNSTENKNGGNNNCYSRMKKLNFFCNKKGGQDNSWYSYRSVQELKTAGIIFRPNKESNFVTDVRYEPLIVRAILRLPPMTIDDSTQSLLLNLVAYEMCPDTPNHFGVTSYIWLMDTLIDHADDVKELRKKGILLNYLGSDEEVAQLFNEIAKNLVANPHAYGDVKNKIESHYKNKVRIWMTEWLHTHFSTPWTVLAFFGAFLAIVLSFIQTYIAIKPIGSNS